MHFNPETVLQLAELLDTELGLERLLDFIDILLRHSTYHQVVDVNDHVTVFDS